MFSLAVRRTKRQVLGFTSTSTRLLHGKQGKKNRFPSSTCSKTTTTTATTRTTRRYLTTSSSNTTTTATTTTTKKHQYVHPLSQIVLEHLQSIHADWMHHHGLDQLTFQADGTFTLTFHNENDNSNNKSNADKGRVWTVYDARERKHYLKVQRGTLVGQYLLQDNTKPAWQDDSSQTSLPEKICRAVDDMIDKVTASASEQRQQQQHKGN